MAEEGHDELTVGLVGKRSGAFVTGIHALPDTRIVGVCDPDARARARLAERAGLRESEQYADYDALLDRARPDAVVLGTPMQLHVPQAVQALDAGCTSSARSRRPSTWSSAGRWCARCGGRSAPAAPSYMMAENYCYRKDVVLVRAMARAGLSASRYFAEGEYLHDVKHLHHFPDGTPHLARHLAGGQAGLHLRHPPPRSGAGVLRPRRARRHASAASAAASTPTPSTRTTTRA